MLHRKQSSETDPADWFFAAADRLRVADGTWERDGLTLSGVELLQEAVERYLKGWLIAQGWSLDRTHDLRKLISVAMTVDPAFNRFKSFADELTDDFFAQHYPGGDWTNVGQNYETLRQRAGEMIKLIQQNLPQYFTMQAEE
jgi:HEPN domain-containing protein